MIVCQINTVYKSGSTGKIAKDINGLLLDNGHKSYVAYGRGKHQDKNSIKIGSKNDMYLHAIGTRLFDKHGLYSKKATQNFIKEIEKLDIDVFHLHNIHGYYLHYPTLFTYLKKVNKPIVWTLHDCWSYTGHCSYYDYSGCDKWMSECHDCPQTNMYPSSLVFDNSKDNFALKKEYFLGLKNLAIVTPSNWLASEVKKSFLKEYDVRTVNNGIDLSVFKKTETNFRKNHNIEEDFLILGVANVWEDRKGFDYFIKLSKLISDNKKIILIGLNENQLKDLPRNIIGIIRTNNQQELAEIYSCVDVFVNLTLEDNFPTTNLESLGCGTPVITFNSGGSPECIDENCGLVVEKENIDEVYDAIQKVQKDGKAKYSEYCIEMAKKIF